jgi:hypothetical protein
MPAVHIKDWSSLHTRSPHRYQRGFCDFGEGDVPISAVVQRLIGGGYQGTIVAEQNYPPHSTQSAVKSMAKFFCQLGFDLDPNVEVEPRLYPSVTVEHSNPGANVENRITSHFGLAPSVSLTDFYDRTAKCLCEAFNARKGVIWSVNPTQSILTLVGLYPETLLGRDTTIPRSEALTSIALDQFEPCTFDLHSKYPGAKYGRMDATFKLPGILDEHDLHLLAIPVYSPYNHNHERLVCSLLCKSPPNDDLARSISFGIGDAIAFSADNIVDYKASCMSNAGRQAVLGARTLDQFAPLLCNFIKHEFSAEAVSLFVEDPEEGALFPSYSTNKLIWHVAEGERFYRPNQGLTGRAWARAETINTAHALSAPGRQGRSSEQVETSLDASLIVPLALSATKAIGIIRCQNKRVDDGNKAVPFNDDDAILIESVAAAVTPQLQLLLQQRRANESLVRLAHELSGPLILLKGAVVSLERDLKAGGPPIQGLLKEDYLGDIQAFAEFYERLIGNVNFFGLEALHPRFDAPYFLLADIVAPAVSQLHAYLRRSGAWQHTVTYSASNI